MWLRVVLLVTILLQCSASDETKCPDSDIKCPAGHSCCLSLNGKYGCCPFPDAVCCSDNLHCCPGGFKCNVTDGTCFKAEKQVPARKPSPAKPVTVSL